MKNTIDFYDQNSQIYYEKTRAAPPVDLLTRFLKHLPEGGRILDAGSGSGRDTLYFIENGFKVTAFDASKKLAQLSSEYTGVEKKVVRFESWEGPASYFDGIWAHASLLHVTPSLVEGVVTKLGQSLKSGGVLFASFKYGEGETVDRQGRSYTNMTTISLSNMLQASTCLEAVEVWEREGTSAYDGLVRWAYLIARRR